MYLVVVDGLNLDFSVFIVVFGVRVTRGRHQGGARTLSRGAFALPPSKTSSNTLIALFSEEDLFLKRSAKRFLFYRTRTNLWLKTINVELQRLITAEWPITRPYFQNRKFDQI